LDTASYTCRNGARQAASQQFKELNNVTHISTDVLKSELKFAENV
jgi:flagellar basal body rod protein FlgF